MEKSKFSMEKIGKYLREVSVVVIGVAITLSASYWITNRNEKRDMALYLDAIKLELEENIKAINQYAESLQGSVRYAEYLQSNDKKSLNADTISSYAYYYGTVPACRFRVNAFETFKSSGFMRLMDDRDLLLTVWDAYAELDWLRLELNECNQLKMEDIRKYIQLLAEGTPHIPMYNFYISNIPYKMAYNCEETSKILKESLEKLEKRK
jgi:hypothetical protein